MHVQPDMFDGRVNNRFLENEDYRVLNEKLWNSFFNVIFFVK